MLAKNDEDAWHLFPEHRWWFNKLELSIKLGYNCGPCGTMPRKQGKFVVRPIYNLVGMSANAKIETLAEKDYNKVPPGHFWCEYFSGNQYSADFFFENEKWHCYSAYRSHRNEKNPLYRFDKWTRIERCFYLPEWFNCLKNVQKINVEFIDDKIIEVHLRTSPDPQYDEIIPVWSDQDIDESLFLGYSWIDSIDSGDDHLPTRRLGFFVKGNENGNSKNHLFGS